MRLVLFQKVAGQLLQAALMFQVQYYFDREVSNIHSAVIFLPDNDIKFQFNVYSFGKASRQTTTELLN